MKSFYELFLHSSKELKNVRNLVMAGLLIAIKLVLNLFTVQITPTLHLSFEFLALAVCSMLFGPVVGAVCGGLSDVINYMINPMGTFFPGFTLSAMISGIIYGIILYKKEPSLIRCIVIEVLIVLFIDILLNTFWLSVLYGKAFNILLPVRVLKNLVMIPINVSIMYFILNLINKIKKNNFQI